MMKVTAAAVIFNESATMALFGKRTDNNRWAIIGGHVDEGETSEQALRREVFEETGITPHHMEPVCFFEDMHPNGNWTLVLVYAVVVTDDTVTSNREPEKNSELKWYHIWDIPRINPWCGFQVIRKCQSALLTAS